MNPRVSINIVAWNSMSFLPDLMASISAQTFRDFSALVIDNGSTDGAVDFLREKYPDVTVIRNARNLGFSPAHNQGIRYALEHWSADALADRFVLVTNPDIILKPSFLEELLRAADEHPEYGSFGGKLLRAYSENAQDEALKETVRSDRLDSTGFTAHKSRAFTDRGAGELDGEQYDDERDVFGISGAMALYRASALQNVRFADEFFDADFFAYKEDVDLSWRLQWQGWRALYVPEAVAYHYRGMYGQEKAGWLEIIRNRRRKSLRRSFYSTRNHWCMLFKNESFINGLLAFPQIAAAELARFVCVLLFEPANARAFSEAVARLPRMWRKRRETMRRRRVKAREMRKWFT